MSTADVVTKSDPGNVWLDVLVEGHRWQTTGQDKTTISVHLASAEPVDYFGDPAQSFAPRAAEKAAFDLTLQLFENIINVDFVNAADVNDADIFLAHVDNEDGDGALGFAYLPGETRNAVTGEDQSGIAVNRDAYYTSNLASLKQGGYDFITYIHEFGHALGLNHPHDLPDVFPGVNNPFDDYGAYDQNQGVYTMESYNDGWRTGPDGPLDPNATPIYGWEATPMAFDVAALQYLYGANLSFRAGNDTYTLPAANGLGTFYSCIWDAGGIDTLHNLSDLDSTLDLRPATLRFGPGAGGFVSYAEGINGGFTIANGVVIENGVGGAGNDKIIGNQAANLLAGGAGDDTLTGNEGNDTLRGGDGGDNLNGGAGVDHIRGNSGGDFLTGRAGADIFEFVTIQDSDAIPDYINDFGVGADRIRLTAIDAVATGETDNDAFDFIGQAVFTGIAGQLRFTENAVRHFTWIIGDVDGDRIADLRIKLAGLHDLTAADFFL